MDEQIGWFARAVNLDAFTKPTTARAVPPSGPSATSKESKDKKTKTKKTASKGAVIVTPDPALLCPARVEATREDGIEMLDFFFDFATSPQRKEKFEFWFDLWKQNYYVVFYPQISLDLALVSGITDHRFAAQCPIEVQHCIVERLTKWVDDPFISAILWLPRNGPLLMEVSRQACCLPITWNYTIRLGIDLMRSYITGGKAKLSAADTQHYWKQFMGNLSLVFFIKTSQREEELEMQAALCNEILTIFATYSAEFASRMENETWVALQRIILDTTYTLLNNNSPFGTSIAGLMADHLFQTLYLVWIRSTVTTKELWEEFSKKVYALTAWKATVNEWKQKVIQLTYILISHLYDSKQEKPSAEKESEGDEKGDSGPASGLASPRKVSTLLAPPTRQPPDTQLTSLPWNSQSIYKMWYTILNILGNLCDIQDSNNFSLAISCVAEMIELLLYEEAHLNITTTPPISIYTTFLPWILQACTVEEKRNRGRLTALATLCRVFVRQHVVPLHIDLLSHFYRIVQQVLQSGNAPMIYVLFRHGSHIFSMDLSGASVLIPGFLKEIDTLWKTPKVPEDVQNKSLSIVLSLVPYPAHFAHLDLPDMTTAQMDSLIGHILQSALKSREITASDKIFCLWGITERILVYLLSDNGSNKEEVHEMVRAILSCTAKEENVSRAALDSLSTIAQPPFLNLLSACDINILYSIVDTLSDNVISLVHAAIHTVDAPNTEVTVAAHFHCLLELFLSVGSSEQVELAPSVISKVFSALSSGLLGEETSDKPATPSIGRGLAPRPDAKKRAERPGKPLGEASIAAMESMLESVKSPPAHKSDLIREAAEVFLLTLLNHFKNFPTIVGSEQVTCHPAEYSGDKKKSIEPAEATGENTIFFIYDTLYIYAFEELAQGFISLTSLAWLTPWKISFRQKTSPANST
eukprot:TRINITY_DN1108_c0_g1_i2.p1 TRINITY_DN1108_c0_g1~~TRINITY_DN1108_c0_g1_i2.p1  ORF type:complete len:963 (-),score=110.16 TRINITY_DN1108_c0_g1_i2:2923-5697(-)